MKMYSFSFQLTQLICDKNKKKYREVKLFQYFSYLLTHEQSDRHKKGYHVPTQILTIVYVSFTYLSVNTAPLSDVGWRVRLHPQGRNRDTILGESLLSSPLFYRGFMNFSTALLSCFFCYECHLFLRSLLSPLGLITCTFWNYFYNFSWFLTKFPFLPLFLHLFLTCPEHGVEAAAPRYSPTKTHMHFESLVKKSLWVSGPGRPPGRYGWHTWDSLGDSYDRHNDRKKTKNVTSFCLDREQQAF